MPERKPIKNADLDYFYGQSSELFSFYRIPKLLFQDSRFQPLSTDAKTLYGIGNRIFTLRTNAKLSQEKLAEKLGVSHRHLGDLERGSSNGSVKILIDIAEYFHVSMDYLLLGRNSSKDLLQNELQVAIDHLEKVKGLL